jgi:N-acetylneuraminic acid mutarotase
MTYLTYLSFNIIIYYLLFNISLSFLIYEVKSFSPAARVVHSSVFVESNNRLYFLGGEINGNIPVNEVFYLDVSKKFDTTSPPWTDLTPSAAIPFRSSWAGVSTKNINNDPIIYLFGGYMLDNKLNQDSFTSNLHTFNVTTQQWSIPQIQGKSPTRRRNMKTIIDDSGIIYIFGGYFIVPTTPQQDMFNDMIKIDMNTLTLSFGSIQNGPARRCAYTATLLPKGIIVYIGGYKEDGNNTIVDINEVFIYNTKLDSWSMMAS